MFEDGMTIRHIFLRPMNVLSAFLLACTFGFLALPLAAGAEPAEKVYRIGFLNTRSVVPNPLGPNPAYREFDAFVQRMRELGYVVGQNLVIEIRGAEAAYDRLPGFAADLVNLKPDLIVTPTTAAARAVKNATGTIPVVVIAAGDPVGDGLIASLARPGGNVTGLTSSSEDLTEKRLQLLTQAVPKVTRLAVLGDADSFQTPRLMKATQAAAPTLGLEVQPVLARNRDEFDAAFSAARRGHAGAVNVLPSPPFIGNGARIAEAAIKHGLPTMFEFRSSVEAGGLMSYGTNLTDLYRRAATCADKLLKGADPATLPVEQPTVFELVINLKTAKTLGLTIPPSVLSRADELIH
jgi:putative ABC transport system substrate-binding protein